MRRARLKPEGRDMFYHAYNRIAGTSFDRPFGNVEKAKFVQLLNRLVELYTVEVIGYTVMSNHFHLLLFAPVDVPDDQETCARVSAYYQNRVRLHAGTRRCREVATRLRDISGFMHDLEHQFSAWFNKTRPVRRRGALWAGRFKHTLLEEGIAVWDCWKYIEMNPVRAGMVSDPAAYRYSSAGFWAGRGRHPFADAVENRLMPVLGPLLGVRSQRDLHRSLRRAFAMISTLNAAPEQADQALKEASRPTTFRISLTHHVRYWTDGLIIGSQRFIRDVWCGAVTCRNIPIHWTPAERGAPSPCPPFFSGKRLRTLSP